MPINSRKHEYWETGKILLNRNVNCKNIAYWRKFKRGIGKYFWFVSNTNEASGWCRNPRNILQFLPSFKLGNSMVRMTLGMYLFASR